MTTETEEPEIVNIDHQLELLRTDLAEEFGEFANGINIEWKSDPPSDSLKISATFTIGAKETLSNMALRLEPTFLRLELMRLVHSIERTLYDMLPVYRTLPQIGGAKIRVDSHLPKGVIWMHPETFANIMRNPEL